MAPVIHEYTADVLPSGPTQTRQARDMDTGDIGNAISHVGDAISKVGDTVQKREDQAQVTQVSSQLAEFRANQSDNLDSMAMSADGHDQDLSDRFMDQYDEASSGIRDSISNPAAQAYFDRQNSELRASFRMHSMTQQGALAGQAAETDYSGVMKNLGSSVLSNPSSFQDVVKQQGQALDQYVSTGLISQTQADKMAESGKSKLAESAISGMVNLNPQAAKAQLNSGMWDPYVDGLKKDQMLGWADQGIRAQQAENDRIKKQQDDLQQAKVDASKSQIFARMVQDPYGVSTKDILKANLPFEDTKQLITLQSTVNKEKLDTSNSGTFHDLFSRIHSDDSTQKITDDKPLIQAVADGKLTVNDMDKLRKEMNTSKTPEGKQAEILEKNFLATAKQTLVKSNAMGLQDPEGMTHYQAFLSDYMKSKDAAVKSGASLADYYNPKNDNYFGKNLSSYTRTTDQILKSQYSAHNAGVAPSANGAQTAPGQSAQPASARAAPPPGLSFDEFRKWKRDNP